jgi:hypothetical protein
MGFQLRGALTAGNCSKEWLPAAPRCYCGSKAAFQKRLIREHLDRQKRENLYGVTAFILKICSERIGNLKNTRYCAQFLQFIIILSHTHILFSLLMPKPVTIKIKNGTVRVSR